MRSDRLDITGQRFGRLIVLCEAPCNTPKYRRWKCICDCGNECETYQHSLKAKTKPTRSCGCLKIEHGKVMNRKHGAYETVEYQAWEAMRSRCNNSNVKKFHNHGGRGVKVCERWNDFSNFIADMGLKPAPKHTLERIDNEGDYSPENCKWATYKEQQRNRRITVFIECDGLKLTCDEWAERIGIPRDRIYRRLRHGVSLSKILYPGILERSDRT